MSMLTDDPNFTGSSSHAVEPESFRITLPVRITIQQVDNYTNGKITDAYYTWTVYLEGGVISRFMDQFGLSLPRSRKSAISQAKRFARAYALNSKPDGRY